MKNFVLIFGFLSCILLSQAMPQIGFPGGNFPDPSQFGSSPQQQIQFPGQFPGQFQNQFPGQFPGQPNQLPPNQQQPNQQQPNQQQPNQQQTTTTTGRPRGPATTLAPEIASCNQRCRTQTTSQYNPVCGTDGQSYDNRSLLDCARRCGTNTEFERDGRCPA